jgi:hypothetical protein
MASAIADRSKWGELPARQMYFLALAVPAAALNAIADKGKDMLANALRTNITGSLAAAAAGEEGASRNTPGPTQVKAAVPDPEHVSHAPARSCTHRRSADPRHGAVGGSGSAGRRTRRR